MKDNIQDEILIIVSGGVVQSVFSSNKNIKVNLLDYDNKEVISDEDAEKEFEIRKQGLYEILF